MDDKEKSAIDKLTDIVTGETVKSAVVPTGDTEAEAVAEKTNEQMLVGDAAIAPEAAPALIAPKKTVPKKRRAAPKKSAKQVAQPVAKTPKKTAKKTAKKAAKKSSTKSPKKTKSSAGRKTVGKNKTAKKVAKKKKAKKSKR
jgi:RNA polymerase primary sigma factor